jgi:hypothetical protein
LQIGRQQGQGCQQDNADNEDEDEPNIEISIGEDARI